MNALPFLEPVKKLLQSRKFLLSLAFLIIQVVIRLSPSPEVKANADSLFWIVTIALGLPFAHLSMEDLIKLMVPNNPDKPSDLEGAVREIVQEVLGTVFPTSPLVPSNTALAPAAASDSNTGALNLLTNALGALAGLTPPPAQQPANLAAGLLAQSPVTPTLTTPPAPVITSSAPSVPPTPPAGIIPVQMTPEQAAQFNALLAQIGAPAPQPPTQQSAG